MKRLVFTVTNDLNYDQRMIRICASLNNAGYNVLLIGRKGRSPLIKTTFLQKRLFCFFNKGKLFYLEYNLRLFIFLLFTRFDLICAIDLDTIIPCYAASALKRKKRVYDAHELFCEMKEIVSRPVIFRIWKYIEKVFVPGFQYGYTVNTYIRDVLKKEYNINYEVIRNMPLLNTEVKIVEPENFILYQGAVNHGRGFETLIPAFQWIDVPFFIYGNGNYIDEAKKLIKQYALEDKVFLKNSVEPSELKEITPKAILGITIFENQGLSNYYSLANRFFDYMHAGIPQLCVDYPAYREINDQYKIAFLIKDISSQAIAAAINELLQNKVLQNELRANCFKAKQIYNWQIEEKSLLSFYQSIFLPSSH